MGEASHQFSPEELDRLEDALETIENVDAFDDPSEAVRLGEYRSLLSLSAEALPLQDVPEGVLDGVLQQARAASESELLEVEPPQPAQSWWSRFRKSLLFPALAVAGSTALILLLVQPQADDAPTFEAELAQSKLASADEAAEPSAAATPAEALEEAEPEPERSEAPADGTVVEIARSRRDTAASAAEPNAPGSPAVIGGAAQPSGDPADAKGGESKAADEAGATPRWDLIARGDRARRDGDCATARSEYQAALDDPNDRVRARAYAGLGLCEDRVGRIGAAEEMFGRARDLDPEVAGFLRAERPHSELEAPTRKKARSKAKPSSSKKSSKTLPQQQADPPNAVLDAFE